MNMSIDDTPGKTRIQAIEAETDTPLPDPVLAPVHESDITAGIEMTTLTTETHEMTGSTETTGTETRPDSRNNEDGIQDPRADLFTSRLNPQHTSPQVSPSHNRWRRKKVTATTTDILAETLTTPENQLAKSSSEAWTKKLQRRTY